MSAISDFDFFMGHWRGHNRRLRERLRGCTEWEEFASSVTLRPLPGGIGNIEESHFEHDGGHVGIAIRMLSRETQQWSIYWISSRTCTLDPPVFGAFDGPTGTFYGDDVCNGTPVRVRYRWSLTDTPTPRWDQAFSTDGGQTWETNWVMDFTRA